MSFRKNQISYWKIYVWKKYRFWFLEKLVRHKNGFKCLIFELKFLSHVYISMQNDKTIFVDFLEVFMEFLEYFKTCFSDPKCSLPGSGGRPDRSTDVHNLVHVGQAQGTVDRVGRPARELCSLFLGGRSGGRPGSSNCHIYDRWRSTGRSTASRLRLRIQPNG